MTVDWSGKELQYLYEYYDIELTDDYREKSHQELLKTRTENSIKKKASEMYLTKFEKFANSYLCKLYMSKYPSLDFYLHKPEYMDENKFLNMIKDPQSEYNKMIIADCYPIFGCFIPFLMENITPLDVKNVVNIYNNIDPKTCRNLVADFTERDAEILRDTFYLYGYKNEYLLKKGYTVAFLRSVSCLLGLVKKPEGNAEINKDVYRIVGPYFMDTRDYNLTNSELRTLFNINDVKFEGMSKELFNDLKFRCNILSISNTIYSDYISTKYPGFTLNEIRRLITSHIKVNFKIGKYHRLAYKWYEKDGQNPNSRRYYKLLNASFVDSEIYKLYSIYLNNK